MQDVNVGSDYKYALVRGETHENSHAYRIKVNYLFTGSLLEYYSSNNSREGQDLRIWHIQSKKGRKIQASPAHEIRDFTLFQDNQFPSGLRALPPRQELAPFFGIR